MSVTDWQPFSFRSARLRGRKVKVEGLVWCVEWVQLDSVCWCHHWLPHLNIHGSIGCQSSNASTTSSPFWLTRWGRAEVRHIWHLSLVTMCRLVHRGRRTNCCLAVLARPSSSRTRHFLFMRQRSGMTCLLTVVRQLLSIVLNAILNANYFTPRTLINPSNSRHSCLLFRFFAWTDQRVTNWFWLSDPGQQSGRWCLPEMNILVS